MTFKEFLESTFGNIMPGTYTHTGYDDSIKQALRQSPGYLIKVNNTETESEPKVKKKKKKKKKWF